MFQCNFTNSNSFKNYNNGDIPQITNKYYHINIDIYQYIHDIHQYIRK